MKIVISAEINQQTLFRKREERHQANNEEGTRQNIGALGGSGATGVAGAMGALGASDDLGAKRNLEERPTMDVRKAVNTTGGGTSSENKVEKQNENNPDKMFNVRTCAL